MTKRVVLKKVVDKNDFILVEIEAENNLKNYMKALKIIDDCF
jgi:hypothetical protein